MLFQSTKPLMYFFKMAFRDSTFEMTDVLVKILISGAIWSVGMVNNIPLDLDHDQSLTTVFAVYSPCPESDDVHMGDPFFLEVSVSYISMRQSI